MKSICKTLEDSLLDNLRLLDAGVPVVGHLETAAAGEVKQEDLTSLQVRVFGVQQIHEALSLFKVKCEIRLNVEQAESADGELFSSAHESVALWLQRVMIGDACVELETDDVYVDGLQLDGGDMDYDFAGGEWFAVWNINLTGRIKGE